MREHGPIFPDLFPPPPTECISVWFLFHCCCFCLRYIDVCVCAERNSILMHLNGFEQRLVDLITGLWLWLWLRFGSVHRISFALWILDGGWPKPFFPQLRQIKHFNNSATKRDEILHTFVEMFVKLPAPSQHRHESHFDVSGSICHNAYNFKSFSQVGPSKEAESIHMQMPSKMLNTHKPAKC